MLQTGNPTATLFSAKFPEQEILFLAPMDWHPFLAEALQSCFDGFSLADLLDGNRVPESIQQISYEYRRQQPAVVALVPKTVDLLEIGTGPCSAGMPVGLIPVNNPEELWPWLQAVRNRQISALEINYQVLSMWKPFYINWANRFVFAMTKGLDENESTVTPLYADETSREDLCRALWSGPQLALYVGHGRSRGWSGYRGFRWEHIATQAQVHPVGSLLTLTCDNLKPRRDGGPGFGVRWILEGRACAFFGAAEAVEVKPLKTIAKFFIAHFSSGKLVNICQLISAVDRDVQNCTDLSVKENWRRFRLIGNPLQPL